jgi:hypothetical protein
MKADMHPISPFVIPAKAGIQRRNDAAAGSWTPAFAGVTMFDGITAP